MNTKVWLSYTNRAIALAEKAIAVEPSQEILDARESIAAFGEYVSQYKAFPHHQEWLNAIQTSSSNGVLKRVAGDNLRISAPRGSAKTTWMIITIAWVIGHNPGIRIILVSYSIEVARAISIAIRNLTQTFRYKVVFPHIRKSKRWADGNWTIDRVHAKVDALNKDPTVLAVGMRGSISGRRADLIVIEDPIRSSEAIANPAIRQAQRTWWGEVLQPTLVPGGRVLVNSTRYRIDDIHGTTFCSEKGWHVIHQRAIIVDEDGNEQSYWTEYEPLERLLTLRAEDPKAFASQRQNDPIADGDRAIEPEWIIKDDVPDDFDAIAIGVDLASSKQQGADYTALVAIGRKRTKWTIHETVKQIIVMHELATQLSGSVEIAIEAVQYQSSLKAELKRVAALEYSRYLRVRNVTTRGSKEDRLRSVSGVIETGNHIFMSNTKSVDRVISELLEFGVGVHDDLADAWAIAQRALLRKGKPITPN
jgi:predicted phage terminase large subunit-like protein